MEINRLSHSEEKQITELLLGRRIVEVDLKKGNLTLDDGTLLIIEPNEGCGGCNSGWYFLSDLQRVDNAITRVDFDCRGGADGSSAAYKIFVYADNEQVNLLTVEGDDDNGYYGTGYSLSLIHI